MSFRSPSGTYLLFSAMDSLKSMDAYPMRNKRVMEAMGEDRSRFDKLVGEAILFSENALFSLSPKMSYVSKEFASGDPEFWTPKPKTVAKPAQPAKPAEKTGQ